MIIGGCRCVNNIIDTSKRVSLILDQNNRLQ